MERAFNLITLYCEKEKEEKKRIIDTRRWMDRFREEMRNKTNMDEYIED